jgi:hypothetical protein
LGLVIMIVVLVSITPVMLNLIDYPRLKLIEMIKMIVMIMKVIMKVIMKIECIGVIVRLVSRRGGSLN